MGETQYGLPVMGGTGLAEKGGGRYSPQRYDTVGSGGSGGVGAAGGLPPPTVREIHSEETAWTSGDTERRGERGRGRGEVVRRLRYSFLGHDGDRERKRGKRKKKQMKDKISTQHKLKGGRRGVCRRKIIFGY